MITREEILAWMDEVCGLDRWNAQRWAKSARISPTSITRFLDKRDTASLPRIDTLQKLEDVAPVLPPWNRKTAPAAEDMNYWHDLILDVLNKFLDESVIATPDEIATTCVDVSIVEAQDRNTFTPIQRVRNIENVVEMDRGRKLRERRHASGEKGSSN